MRRLRGLLGWNRLEPGSGMLLRPAWSIHTAFVRFPMDVVFIDPDQVIIRVEPNLRPFKTASCRGAREVVELAAGEAGKRGLRVGDRITWAPRAPDSAKGGPACAGRAAWDVLLASRDGRLIKLARFLSDSGIEGGLQRDAQPPDGIEGRPADVVVLEAHDHHRGLKTAIGPERWTRVRSSSRDGGPGLAASGRACTTSGRDRRVIDAVEQIWTTTAGRRRLARSA